MIICLLGGTAMVMLRILHLVERLWKRRVQAREVAFLTKAVATGQVATSHMEWDRDGTPRALTLVSARRVSDPAKDLLLPIHVPAPSSRNR